MDFYLFSKYFPFLIHTLWTFLYSTSIEKYHKILHRYAKLCHRFYRAAIRTLPMTNYDMSAQSIPKYVICLLALPIHCQKMFCTCQDIYVIKVT